MEVGGRLFVFMEYASLRRHILSFSEILPFSLNEFTVGHFRYILESKRVL
jgi:hypothetical protein